MAVVGQKPKLDAAARAEIAAAVDERRALQRDVNAKRDAWRAAKAELRDARVKLANYPTNAQIGEKYGVSAELVTHAKWHCYKHDAEQRQTSGPQA